MHYFEVGFAPITASPFNHNWNQQYKETFGSGDRVVYYYYYYYYYYYLLKLSFHSVTVGLTLVTNKNNYKQKKQY